MGARDALVAITIFGATSAEVAEARINAYRAEVLREARREILALSLSADDLKARQLWKAGYKGGLAVAAEICTP